MNGSELQTVCMSFETQKPAMPTAPDGAVTGCLVFGELVRAALGSNYVAGGACGDLNVMTGCFSVRDLEAGLNTVKRCLQLAIALEYSRIGWFDVRELVWRIWFPRGSGERFNPEQHLAAIRERLFQAHPEGLIWPEQGGVMG